MADAGVVGTDGAGVTADQAAGAADATAAGSDPDASLWAWVDAYLALGWKLFFLSSGKLPVGNCPACPSGVADSVHDRETCPCLTCHTFYAATGDKERLRAMRRVVPDGVLALRTGTASGVVVVDAEAQVQQPLRSGRMAGRAGAGRAPGEGVTGLDVLDAWEDWASDRGWPSGVELAATATAHTVSGGVHLFYRTGDVRVASVNRVYPGVDVKAEGGYVALPPGRFGERSWKAAPWNGVGVAVPDGPLARWFADVRGAARETRQAGAGSGGPGGFGGGRGAVRGQGTALWEGTREEFWSMAREAPRGTQDETLNSMVFRLVTHERVHTVAGVVAKVWPLVRRWDMDPARPWTVEHVRAKAERIVAEHRSRMGVREGDVVRDGELPEWQKRAALRLLRIVDKTWEEYVAESEAKERERLANGGEPDDLADPTEPTEPTDRSGGSESGETVPADPADPVAPVIQLFPEGEGTEDIQGGEPGEGSEPDEESSESGDVHSWDPPGGPVYGSAAAIVTERDGAPGGRAGVAERDGDAGAWDEDDGDDGDGIVGYGGSAWDGNAGTEGLHDTGNANRLVRLHGRNLRWLAGEECWLIWDGVRWKRDERQQALAMTMDVMEDLHRDAHTGEPDRKDAVLKFMRSSYSAGRRMSMLRLAQAVPGVMVTHEEMDRDPWQLVVQNGVLDLRTGVLGKARRDDLNTRCADVAYDAEATCPRWLRHVELVSGGDPERAAYLRRIAGYTLTGLTTEQAFFSLEGNGDNGKNAFVEPLMMLMGDYAGMADSKLVAGGDREHMAIVADIVGKRLVFVDEVPEKQPMDVERVKAMTGAQCVKARLMGKNWFEFRPVTKLWIAGNHQPPIDDSSDGLWRRMQRVIFAGKIPAGEKVLGFADLLFREEAAGILNWCLEGLRDWVRRGGIGTPESVREETRQLRMESDVTGMFFTECCEVTGRIPIKDGHQVLEGSGDWVSVVDLYRVYEAWCEIHGIQPRDRFTSIGLGRRTARLDGVEGYRDRRDGGRQDRGYEGVRLTTSAARLYAGVTDLRGPGG